MSAMSAKRVFAPPHPSSLNRRRLSRKRKRLDHEDSGTSDDERNANANANTIDLTAPTTLNPQLAEQYRVAGFSATDDLPPHPFPHAPVKRPPSANQRPAAHRPPRQSSKKHQLDGLTALLHHSVLAGDFERARRAWRLLLRAQTDGHPVDPRSQGRWGIGAEILLRQRGADGNAVTPAGLAEGSDSNGHVDGGDGVHAPPAFDIDSVRAARQFYERMILQYPYQRSNPNRVDALTFYPPLFGLWIYEVTESSRRARAALVEDDDSHDLSNSDLENSTLDHLPSRARQLADVQTYELTQARQIADRLDQLLLSPPTDQDPDLLHLRGMLALWIGDLLVQSISADARQPSKIPSSSDDDRHSNDNYAAMADFNRRIEVRNGLAAKEVEIERAKAFFRRAAENGAQVWEGVSYLFREGG